MDEKRTSVGTVMTMSYGFTQCFWFIVGYFIAYNRFVC